MRKSGVVSICGLVFLGLMLSACQPAAPAETAEVIVEATAAPTETAEVIVEATAAPTETAEVVVEAPELVMFMNVGESEIVERLISPVIQEELGVTLIMQEKNSTEQITALIAQAAAPEVTLACGMVPSDFMTGLEAGVFEPIDYSRVPNTEGLYAAATSEPYGEYGVAFAGGGLVIQYYLPVFEQNGWDAPASLADLADPRYAGHVGLVSTVSTVGASFVDMLSNIAGAPRGDITPGIEYAQELVAAGQVHSFPTRSSEVNTLMENGEIWISTTWSGGALQAIRQGAPYAAVIPEEGTQLVPIGCHLVEGAANLDVGLVILNLMLGEDFQTEYSLDRLQFPMRPVAGLPTEYQSVLPTTEEQMAQIAMPDWTEWAEYRAEWTSIWTREVEAGG